MIGCLRTRVRNQPIIALYFESENDLKLYNLEAWSLEKIYSYNLLNKMFTCSYIVLWFLYTLFAVCKHSLQINITILVSELNI